MEAAVNNGVAFDRGAGALNLISLLMRQIRQFLDRAHQMHHVNFQGLNAPCFSHVLRKVEFIRLALTLTLTAFSLLSPAAPAQTPTAPVAPATAAAPASAAFTQAALPYAYGALEPIVDEATMRIHFERHHGAQVAGLNAAIVANPAYAGKSLEALLAAASAAPAAIRNNAGGHWNHSFYWKSMAPL
eukprot:gene59340-79176_t